MRIGFPHYLRSFCSLAPYRTALQGGFGIGRLFLYNYFTMCILLAVAILASGGALAYIAKPLADRFPVMHIENGVMTTKSMDAELYSQGLRGRNIAFLVNPKLTTDEVMKSRTHSYALYFLKDGILQIKDPRSNSLKVWTYDGLGLERLDSHTLYWVFAYVIGVALLSTPFLGFLLLLGLLGYGYMATGAALAVSLLVNLLFAPKITLHSVAGFFLCLFLPSCFYLVLTKLYITMDFRAWYAILLALFLGAFQLSEYLNQKGKSI